MQIALFKISIRGYAEGSNQKDDVEQLRVGSLWIFPIANLILGYQYRHHTKSL